MNSPSLISSGGIRARAGQMPFVPPSGGTCDGLIGCRRTMRLSTRQTLERRPAKPLRGRRHAIVAHMKETNIEGKIDDLARMVADGFTEIRGDMRELRDEMATKADLAELREEMLGVASKEDLVRLKGDFDIMLDRHIGTFRRDYDELAGRVKHLEQLVMK